MKNKESFTYRRYRDNKDKIWLVRGGLIIATFLAVYFIITNLNSPWSLGISALSIIILAIISRADKLLEKLSWRNYRTWGKGARAELAVGNSLEKLGSDYQLIHNLDMGHGDIDNLCIGPTGIFVVETKANSGTISYSDKLLINGRESKDKDFIGQVWHEIDYTRKTLKQKFGRHYFVNGILEFPNAKVDQSVNSPKQGIWIGGAGFANYIIKRSQPCLSPEEIKNISDFFKNNKK